MVSRNLGRKQCREKQLSRRLVKSTTIPYSTTSHHQPYKPNEVYKLYEILLAKYGMRPRNSDLRPQIAHGRDISLFSTIMV